METNPGSDFARALDFIESSEVAVKIKGLLILESLGDERSCRVVERLKNDPAKGVRFQAERILKKFHENGLGSNVEIQHKLSQVAYEIENGSGILRETVTLLRRHFFAVYSSFWIFAIVKVFATILLIRGMGLAEKGFTGVWHSIVVFVVIHSLFMPVVWHLWGSLFSGHLPNYQSRDRFAVKPGVEYLFSLLRGELFSALPLLILLVFLLPLKAGILLFLVLLPVSLKLSFLSFPLIPLKVLNLKTWQTPLENCLTLFAQSNKLMTSFLRPGFIFYSLGVSIAFLLLLAVSKFLSGNLLLEQFWLCLMLSDSLIAPVWMGYRIIFSLLFFPESR